MSATLERDTPRTNRNRPIECDVCGLKLRGAFGPLERIGLPSCACGGAFVWRHEADGYRSSDPAACPAVCESEAAYDRQLARRAHDVGLGLGRRKRQCGSCRKILADAHRGACPHCGAVNGQRDGDWSF